MSLSGWVCVVTGASRGIGKGIALQLSEAGATVYITGRQENTLKQTAAQVKFWAWLSCKGYIRQLSGREAKAIYPLTYLDPSCSAHKNANSSLQSLSGGWPRKMLQLKCWWFSALHFWSSSVSVRFCLYGSQLTCLYLTQVKERGGNCVPVICDSTKGEDIEELFEQIKREQNGRLDILVNNAYAGVQVDIPHWHETLLDVSLTLHFTNYLWNTTTLCDIFTWTLHMIVIPGYLREYGEQVLGNGSDHLGFH